MPNNIYYVYTLIDPRNDKIFYVGKGKDKRWREHFRKFGHNPHKDNIIKKLLSHNMEPIVKFPFKELDEETAYQKEAELISFYGRESYDEGGILTNILIDGRPPDNTGRRHSKETKEKLSKIRKLRTGYKLSKETKQKLSKAHTGKKHSDNSKKKMSESARRGWLKRRVTIARLKLVGVDGIEPPTSSLSAKRSNP